jgi:transposase
VSTQDYLFEPIPHDKLDTLSKEEFKALVQGQDDLIAQLRKLNEELLSVVKATKEQSVLVQEQLLIIKSKFFGRSSEKPASDELRKSHLDSQRKLQKKERVQLPSLRYPNLPIIERDILVKDIANCSCCGDALVDSGMTEDSERLSVNPKKYIIERIKRHIYRCESCHGALKTANNLPRVKEGSSYSDELMIDVVVAKYDHLIPVERYVRIAEDLGVEKLPSHSLIETTHYTADFLTPIYEGIKKEVLAAEVLHADETPHRMLEGDKKKSWYLWGFSTNRSSYFELHGTRSGDVASDFLSQACCSYLVSDVYSGYKKAVTEANIIRKEEEKVTIQSLYCNAHARRKFHDSQVNFKEESEWFLKSYQKIYLYEKISKKVAEKNSSQRPRVRTRARIKKILLQMQKRALEGVLQYPEKSSIGKALSYFIKNFEELSRFTSNIDLPLDNNLQERQMRNPVIGRKTWYGTHSKRGAKTAAILFSIIESCKLNGLNSQEYITAQVLNIHMNKPIQTPSQFKMH